MEHHFHDPRQSSVSGMVDFDPRFAPKQKKPVSALAKMSRRRPSQDQAPAHGYSYNPQQQYPPQMWNSGGQGYFSNMKQHQPGPVYAGYAYQQMSQPYTEHSQGRRPQNRQSTRKRVSRSHSVNTEYGGFQHNQPPMRHRKSMPVNNYNNLSVAPQDQYYGSNHDFNYNYQRQAQSHVQVQAQPVQIENFASADYYQNEYAPEPSVYYTGQAGENFSGEYVQNNQYESDKVQNSGTSTSIDSSQPVAKFNANQGAPTYIITRSDDDGNEGDLEDFYSTKANNAESTVNVIREQNANGYSANNSSSTPTSVLSDRAISPVNAGMSNTTMNTQPHQQQQYAKQDQRYYTQQRQIRQSNQFAPLPNQSQQHHRLHQRPQQRPPNNMPHNRRSHPQIFSQNIKRPSQQRGVRQNHHLNMAAAAAMAASKTGNTAQSYTPPRQNPPQPHPQYVQQREEQQQKQNQQQQQRKLVPEKAATITKSQSVPADLKSEGTARSMTSYDSPPTVSYSTVPPPIASDTNINVKPQREQKLEKRPSFLKRMFSRRSSSVVPERKPVKSTNDSSTSGQVLPKEKPRERSSSFFSLRRLSRARSTSKPKKNINTTARTVDDIKRDESVVRDEEEMDINRAPRAWRTERDEKEVSIPVAESNISKENITNSNFNDVDITIESGSEIENGMIAMNISTKRNDLPIGSFSSYHTPTASPEQISQKIDSTSDFDSLMAIKSVEDASNRGIEYVISAGGY